MSSQHPQSSQQTPYSGAVTSMITYGDSVQGFLAIPENQPGPFGAVVLGHERYGLAQHTLDLAAKFAAHGYVCLAPDMFSRWEGDKAALSRGDIRVSISDEDIPLQSRIETAAEDSDLEEIYNTERHLLYVACTRARDHLLVTSVHPASEFLEDMRMC